MMSRPSHRPRRDAVTLRCMGERVRHGLVTLVPAESWARVAASTPRQAPLTVPDYVLRSPRSDGRFQLNTVAMPEDMGTFDVERLRKLVERSWRSATSYVRSIDETAWSEQGIACIARTAVSDSDAPFARRLREAVAKSNAEQGAELARFFSDPRVRRDWYVACGSEMANIWYCCANGDAVAVDLVDCEEMVRSIRFVRASG